MHPRLKVLEAFKRALATWARWVDKNIDSNKTEVVFRGYSVTHFRYVCKPRCPALASHITAYAIHVNRCLFSIYDHSIMFVKIEVLMK